MEDRETGAGPPDAGASRVAPPPDGQSEQARQRGPVHRHAGHSGHEPSGEDAGAASQHGKPRKRRKRKRGRKVFARDASAGTGATPKDLRPPPVTSASARPSGDTPFPRQQEAAVKAVASSSERRELPVFAALDLGTNNCRLLVAVPGKGGQFRVIDAFSRIVRLGEGLSASGRLADAAMDRAVEALRICADKLRNRRIRRSRLIATEACRAAANGVEFIERVRLETGMSLEIIDRQTEARLAVSGCGSLVERGTDGVVLFDIGGGSSEIALIDLTGPRFARLADHIVSWTSLPVGVVSLAERFGGRVVTHETFAAMVADVRGMLDRFEGRDRLDHLRTGGNFHLLGTSGTVTTLAGVHLELERYDRRRVDGLWMDGISVDRMVGKLLGWDFQQRVANPCIGADRADLVLAGCAILEAIRAVWPCDRLRVADRGLREGMLSELMAQDGAWRRDGARR